MSGTREALVPSDLERDARPSFYVNVLNIHTEASVIAARIDEYGRGAWIAATVLAFWAFWPAGLALLAFLAFSGRMRKVRASAPGTWSNPRARTWRARVRTATPSGNRAFDEYRDETINRLEEEQREFMEYLERLRQARDRAEFDQFMADRRSQPQGGPVAPLPGEG